MRYYCFLLLLLSHKGFSQVAIPGNPLFQRLIDKKFGENTDYNTIKTAYFTGHDLYLMRGIPDEFIQVLRQLEKDVFVVRIPNAESWKKQQKNASMLLPANNHWKLVTGEMDLLDPAHQQAWLIRVNNLDAFEKKYGALIDVQYRNQSTASVQAIIPNRLLQQLLADNNVSFLSSAKKAVTERELTGFDIAVNKINKVHRMWPNVDGSALTVSIKENKMDTSDIDLRARYRSSTLASRTMQTHATTMCTIIVGAGNSFYTGKGAAHRAAFTSSDFANLLPDDDAEINRLGISVQNHSYGVGIENYYGADAAAYDAQVMRNPFLLQVFSAGNSGTMADNMGRYAGITGYANLTGSFKMAKNILTVGATDSFAKVISIASRGPAFDGRVKPELVALGEDGSSGAAAIVSGIGLLVQDAWKKKMNQLPSAALTKALLINGADDTGPKGIDFLTGYGAVNAWHSINMIEQSRTFTGSVGQSSSNTHRITLPANAINLKITLCWIDPPAQPNAMKALVHDLDLSLVHQVSTQSWQPWVLNAYPHKDSLNQLPQRKRDSLNNTEQISIDEPMQGNYDIVVKGFAVTGVGQAYAIAWQYDTLQQLAFTYPVKGDQLLPGQSNLIRWETTIQDTATLQYQHINGNWQNIATALPLNNGYYQWTAPDTIGTLRLRLLTKGISTFSDTVGMSRNLLINTGFNCIDSFLIYWQKASVDSYRVYQLGTAFLEPFVTVADTALIQLKQNNPNRYFTVAPILPFQTEGRRAYTFDYTNQQVSCYVNGFIADPAGANTARLTLQLGTTYQVAKLVIEKLTATGFVSIREIAPVNTLQHITTEAATKGLNTYRIKIVLTNGVVYYTKAEQVIIFGNQAYYVFPNPSLPGTTLKVLAEDPDASIFALYDLFGRLVAQQKLFGFLNSIQLPLLQRGVYYYTITQSGVRKISRPLIIQ